MRPIYNVARKSGLGDLEAQVRHQTGKASRAIGIRRQAVAEGDKFTAEAAAALVAGNLDRAMRRIDTIREIERGEAHDGGII